jgi:hypothetical protein
VIVCGADIRPDNHSVKGQLRKTRSTRKKQKPKLWVLGIRRQSRGRMSNSINSHQTLKNVDVIVINWQTWNLAVYLQLLYLKYISSILLSFILHPSSPILINETRS